MALPNIQPYDTLAQAPQSFQKSMEDFAGSKAGVLAWMSLVAFASLGTGYLVRKSGHGWPATVAATFGVGFPVFFVDYMFLFAESVPVLAPAVSAIVAYKAYQRS